MAKPINGFHSDRGKFFDNEYDALKDDLTFHIETVAGNGPVGRQIADFIVGNLSHQPDSEPPFIGFADLIARLNRLQGEKRETERQLPLPVDAGKQWVDDAVALTTDKDQLKVAV